MKSSAFLRSWLVLAMVSPASPNGIGLNLQYLKLEGPGSTSYYRDDIYESYRFGVDKTLVRGWWLASGGVYAGYAPRNPNWGLDVNLDVHKRIGEVDPFAGIGLEWIRLFNREKGGNAVFGGSQAEMFRLGPKLGAGAIAFGKFKLKADLYLSMHEYLVGVGYLF